MGDANTDNNGAGEGTAAAAQKDDVSYDLFARLLIKRIVGFLEQRPSDFAITILPPIPKAGTAVDVEEDQTAKNDDVTLPSLKSLSIEHRSLLESSIVLMHEPGINGKSIYHLGLEAQNLPLIARVLRKAYRQAKKKIKNSPSPSSADEEALFHVTSCLLLIQPDHATAWADRRRCIISLQNSETQLSNPLAFENGDEEDESDPSLDHYLWHRELDYLDLLFTQHSKAPSSWAHRKYTLRQMLKIVDGRSVETANELKDGIFAREVKTCIDVADKYPKNYYAWTHRRYLWDIFSFDTTSTKHGEVQEKGGLQEQRELFIQLLETELIVGMWQEWLPKHPADHSAVHYACQVLDLLLNEIMSLQLDSGQPLIEEKIAPVSVSALNQVRILLSKYSEENESLWILRRITYKTLWKHKEFSNAMASLVRSLVRNDLKSIVSSTLSSDVEFQQGDNCNESENDSIITTNPKSIYAWTFLAWCIANLRGIDGHREETNDDCEIIFTPRVREMAAATLTSVTGMVHHNHLVYTSLSSPISELLLTGATEI